VANLSAQAAVQQGQAQGGAATGGMGSMGTDQLRAQLRIIQEGLIGDACPVEMHAQHRSDGNLVRTETAHPKGTGQWLHLTLTGRNAKEISRATLTVEGMSAKGRLQNAASGERLNSSQEMTQTSTVPFAASGDGSSSADFWVPGMTAVQLIDLKSIEYGDGSIWKIADGQSCRVKPDLMMLVSDK
jgi:hypothetical protein